MADRSFEHSYQKGCRHADTADIPCRHDRASLISQDAEKPDISLSQTPLRARKPHAQTCRHVGMSACRHLVGTSGTTSLEPASGQEAFHA